MSASPFLSAREAMELIRRPTLKAFAAFVARHHIPCIQAGRVKLYERDILLAAFTRSTDGLPARMPRTGPSDREVFLQGRLNSAVCQRRTA